MIKSTKNITCSIDVDVNISEEGVSRVTTVDFQLHTLKIRPHGLLESVLSSLPSPVHKSYIHYFKQVVELLSDNKKASKLLSTPLAELESTDITTLFNIAEDVIQKNLVDLGRLSNGFRPSVLFRRVMKYLDTPLSDNALIEDVRFKTRFSESQSSRDVISEMPDYGCEDPEHRAPVSAISARSLKELEEKALSHFESRNERIKQAIYSSINFYRNYVSRIDALMSIQLPEKLVPLLSDATLSTELTIQTLEQLDADALIHFYAHYFYSNQLYSYGAFRKWFDCVDSIPGAPTLLRDKLSYQLGLSSLHASSKYKERVTSLILSYKILPPMIVMAIRHLFQIDFGWNLGTCNSITRSMITSTNKGIHIEAIKPKTSQAFSETVNDNVINNSEFTETINFLLENNDWISANWSHSCESIFKAIHHGENFPSSSNFPYTTYNNRFTSLHELPSFSCEQLRDQKLNTHFLKHKDIHSLQALAGWDSLASAQNYLDQTIIKTLSNANMHDFMQRLQASIIWVTKGDSGIKEAGINPDDVDKKLLFPIDTVNTESTSITEKWLEDDTTSIVITNDRMSHLLRQKKFYEGSWQRLLSENESRFITTHLPQILLCFALDNVVRDSQHANEYQEIESAINE
mgnify:CR=1 FL=1